MEQISHFIGGKHLYGEGSWILKTNPATGEDLWKVPIADEATIDLAASSAYSAFESWSRRRQSERSAVLAKLADLIEAHSERFARLETDDTGKPLWLAKGVDIPRAIENLRFFAESAKQWPSESHSGQAGFNYTLRSPLGVVACISPWNLPLYLLTWKIAPALAVGNTVVAKPSEVTPATAFLLSQLVNEAGFPPGVLNIVHGPGNPSGQKLIEHKLVKAISFTGGTHTGKIIAKTAAQDLKKVSLELGGKNPAILFADCDYKRALTETLRSSFLNQGEICLCTSRIYVEAPIYEQFKQDFVLLAQSWIPEDPLSPQAPQGAIVSEEHFGKILHAIETAKAEGGTILTGGQALQLSGRCRLGTFIRPTVIEGLGIDSITNQTEIFGPVVTIAPFDSEDQVVAWANHSSYGLAATLWTQDLGRTHRIATRLDAGIVWINSWLLRDLRTPFGGVKHSGLGREGGYEALRFFTEAKNVCIHMGDSQ